MCSLGFGLMLLGMAVATYAAEPEDSRLLRSLDWLTVQAAQFDADGAAHSVPYRLTLSLVPVRSTDISHPGSALSETSRSFPIAKPQREVDWATNDNMTRSLDGDRASWLLLLRLEAKGERIEFKPRRHALWLQWNKDFP